MNSAAAFAVGILVLLGGGLLAAASGAVAAPAPAREGAEGVRLAAVGALALLAVLFLWRRRHLL